MMDYEFHVGDYVETKDGFTGYITKVGVVNGGCISLSGIIGFDKDTWQFNDDIEKLKDYFSRIGQYDFTKEDRIEKLTPSGYNINVSGDDLIEKINELIDVVNELRKNNDT